METQQRFDLPKLRTGVKHSFVNGEHNLDYRDQGTVISSSEPALAELIECLKTGGHSPDALKARFPTLAQDVDGIIDSLDNLFLLTESHHRIKDGILSGYEFSVQLKLVIQAFHDKLGNSQLFQLMRSGTATRSQLVGYAVEYFHIVKAAPRVIAPAMSQHCPPAVFSEIKRLFLEEHDHDGMLADAAASAGIDRSLLYQTTPLPATFSVYATLGTFSRQHLLSFICALFLFEEPYPAFNVAFVESAKANGLPDSFWKPIVGHAAINESGGHHLITDELLKHVPAISPSEAQVVLIHITTLLETMAIWDRQICSTYQDEVKLRIFS